jgi:hypothetical protein
MPILLIITAISGIYPDIAVNPDKFFFKKKFFIFIGIFYPSGEPISPHWLRCSPFAVVHYSFMGHFLAAAAILTRE